MNWLKFTAKQWVGFKARDWVTFKLIENYDPVVIWAAARSLFTNQHIICLQTASVAQAVWKRRTQNNIARSAEAKLAWKVN